MKKMTRFDIVKQQFKNVDVSIIDVLKSIDPSGKNTYLEFMTKHVDSKMTERAKYNEAEWAHEITHSCGLSKEVVEKMSNYEKIIFLFLISNVLDRDAFKTLSEYHNLKIKNRLTCSDLTKLKSFDDMSRIVSISNLIHIDKDLEKFIIKLHEDDEWFIIKPLTHVASQKYGSGTKWCTTSNSPDHFRRYSSRGILIYSLNKKSGNKVGTFFSLSPHDKEFSFWDIIDNRIDSLESGLPRFILDLILNENRTCKDTNFDLLTPDQKILEVSYYNNYDNKVLSPLRAVEEPMVDGVVGEIDWGELEESSPEPNTVGTPTPRMTVVNEAYVHDNDSIIFVSDGQTFSVTNDGIDFADNNRTTT